MNTKSYYISNIHCSHCVNTIETELCDLNGVHEVSVNLETKQVDITYELPATEEIIIKTLREIGYPPQE